MPREINFDSNPFITVEGVNPYAGPKEITNVLKEFIQSNNIRTVVFDYYHGVDEKYLYENIISHLGADLYVDTNEIKYPEEVISEKFHCFITDDRVNGVSSFVKIDEFFDPVLKEEANRQVREHSGLCVVYGVGAQVVVDGDMLVYCDIEMEEIHRRYRNGLDNWGAGNYEEEFLRKDKRFMFLESRVQDWHKRPLLEKLDFIIDCNRTEDLVMLNKQDFDEMIHAFVSRPMRPVPFFQPAVWGGHWLKDTLGVGEDLVNTGWGMLGVLEFQAVQAKVKDKFFVMPGKNVYFNKPLEFLGGQIFYMWGYKVPIMVDILDTWGGGNLSLQCHPTVAYNQETFNWPYGHCESYYMLDTMEDSSVYLGTKTGVKIPEFVEALEEAQETGEFDETKWVNNWPMKKHDHIYIPSGTLHCSGRNTLVLEINTFWVSTFKLWDWGRVDLDGKPRPIDIGHGKNVLREEYTTEFVRNRLMSKRVETDRGDGWTKEHSGLMEYEPLHVERYWFEKAVAFDTRESLKVVILVEGEEALIVSPNDAFEPQIMHYAEPFFMPAALGSFYIKPYGKSAGKKLAVLELYQDLGSKY